MQSNNFAGLLKPYKILINKNALSKTYQSLQFSPGKVIGCSAAVILETNCDHGLEETICINGTSFLAIVDSLPDGQELKLEVTEGALHWACGSAKGRLALMAVADMPSISRRPKLGQWSPTAEFAEGLVLGGLSCGSNGLASIGMYGVVIDNRERLVIHSSDNTTVSACFVSDSPIDAPEIITITPEPAALLSDLIQPGEGTVEFDETSIFYIDKHCRCLIKQVPKLKWDALEQIDAFDTDELVAPIPREAIASFIKRVNALAENSRSTYIELQASEGQLSLSFLEGVASADEYYLVKGLDIPEMPAVPLDASKLARAMAHINELGLDHLDRSIIVMRGDNPKFRYLVSGRQKEEAPKAEAPKAASTKPTSKPLDPPFDLKEAPDSPALELQLAAAEAPRTRKRL